MTRKTLDPNLASILESIRATVGGDVRTPAPAPEQSPLPDAESAATLPAVPPLPEADEPGASDPAASKGGRGRKAAAAPPALAQASPSQGAGSGPAADGSRTVEDFLADLIRPQVDAWLKANLPELIQKMAAEEIARLTGRN